MFDRIAPVYDVMNQVMTVGLDQRWRRLTVRAVVSPGDRVLDGCCGTGDTAVAARKAGEQVRWSGLDFSERMLERARRKEPGIEWIRGDLLQLPFEDASFDAATVGFGVQRRRSSAGSPSCGACSGRAAGSASSRSRGRAARSRSSTSSGSTC